MKAVVQRVGCASLKVEGRLISSIENGLVCYLGIGKGDQLKDMQWLARKIAGLRIFADGSGRMNLSVRDLNYEIMVVSQFTLYGDLKNGYRPGFSAAEEPEKACQMYELFCGELVNLGVQKVARGVFGADMHISQNNLGPVTIIIDTSE